MPNTQEIGLAERLGKFITNSPLVAMLIFMAWREIKRDAAIEETNKEHVRIMNDLLKFVKDTKSSELNLKENELLYKYKLNLNDTAK